MSSISLSINEYNELLAAKHTLTLIYTLMCKELDAKDRVSTYIDGEKYMDIMETLIDMVGVENAGQTEDF